MAEETKSPSASSTSSSSAKSGKSGPKRGPSLAPTQGSYEPPGPPDRTPGTPEHLGSARPYEGAVPEVEDR
jgi:hypothetical protein